MKKIFNLGDLVVFPIGAISYDNRYKLIEGKVIDYRGNWLFGIRYCVLYNLNGIDKIEEFSKRELYKKGLVYNDL